MTASVEAPVLPQGFIHRPELSREATSRDLQSAPRHHWFYFPHSYSYRLVDRILDHWALPVEGVVADNFAGAGTTLLTARARGLTVVGFDLSPLAVTVANAKIAPYNQAELALGLHSVLDAPVVEPPEVPDRLAKGFNSAKKFSTRRRVR